MDGQDHPQVGIDVLELLAGETEADVVHARAAPLLRDADPEQLQLGHLAQEVAIETVLPVEIVDERKDVLPAPLAQGGDERLVLVAQLQVDHVSSLSVSSVGSAVSASRARASVARSAGTSTRTFANARTLGTGSWR